MQQVDTLIHPKQILTQPGHVLHHHSLAVNGGKIVGLLPTSEANQRFQAENEYTLPEHLLMPGLVNAHTHISMNLLKGLADDLKLMTWLTDHIWPAEAAVISPEFVNEGALLAMAEMIRGGITCFNDNYFYMDSLAELVDQVGMRAVLAECFFKFSTPWSPSAEASFARTEKLIDFCKTSTTIRAAVFPHAPYSTDIPLLTKIAAFAKKHDLLIHTHLLESQMEIDESLKEHGKRPIPLWHELGLIGKKTIAVHMTHVDETDLALMQESGASVVHCPESNMKLSSGVCPVQKMLDQGINVAIGTDGAASNNDLDLFGEMKSAAFLSKVFTDNPESLNAQTVLEMATINGAKALHWDNEIGSIEIGKAADVIALDLHNVEAMPCYNPTAQLVYAMPRSNVTHSWVNGRILMNNRQLTTIDVPALLKRTQVWQEKLKVHAK
ncbi:MAG: TRZ/ATZ family hydrolase [Gammaproteobacteria bacterium]|nr:TRZ/ATZ family hydrolase [Gammaproteobacteria bacterium]